MHVLFTCPHAAGKSLAAATYLQAAAARRGIEVTVDVAGPDPDPDNMPTVVAALREQGHEVRFSPRRLTADAARRADLVISIGCERADFPPDVEVMHWHVPQLSEDLHGSMAVLRAHVEALILDPPRWRWADVTGRIPSSGV